MFLDRYDAGKQLSVKLRTYLHTKAIILAMPRGALQIGEILHKELKLPLDVIVTKKIPHPNNQELAIGAVGGKNELYIDLETSSGIFTSYIKEQIAKLNKLIEERYLLYRGEKTPPNIKNKTVILVDDGIATGSTIIAAINLLKKQKPKKIIIATPICGFKAYERIVNSVDEIIVLEKPEEFMAIGQFYRNFPQVEDEEAISILKRCRKAI